MRSVGSGAGVSGGGVTGVVDAVDAVVVGAGHNGLVAANILADAGWDVLVCEASDAPGGAVRSGEVLTDGFSTDLFSAFYPLAVASPVLAALHLEDHGLRWEHAPAVLAHVLPDGRSVQLSRELETTADSVARFAAQDGCAWRQLVGEWRRIEDEMVDALLGPFPPVRASLRLLRTLGVGDAERLLRTALLPVRRLASERFAGEGAALLLAGNAMHADIPPEGAGSAMFGWLLAMLGQTHGFPVPHGGAGALIEALTRRLRQRSADVWLNAAVEKVLIVNGAATGVQLADGRFVTARRGVLADVNAPTLFHELVGDNRLPSGFVSRLRDFEWDPPTLKVNWALSEPIGWQAQEARQAGTVHLGVDLDGLTNYSADLITGRMPRHPFIVLGQMTTSDATRSPAGTESAWAYTHLPRRGDAEFGAEEIAAQLQRIEDAVEAQAPGFASRVLARHVQAPAELARLNPNLVHGAINGGTTQIYQQLVFRPVAGFGGSVTPIDRLYLAGSSAHPGGGVHGAPGANAARAALHREGSLGAVRRCVAGAVLGRLYR